MATGQGNYLPNENVTVEAVNNVDGYKFEGWYKCVNNEPTGEVLSTNEVYTFKMPDNDYSLIAVYKTEKLYELSITGYKFKVDGLTKRNKYLGSYPAGTSVTIEYTGPDELVYWSNGVRKLSTSNTYTVQITGNLSIEAITVSDEYEYVFISAYDQVLKMDTYDQEATDFKITSPKAPFKTGGTFDGWQIDGKQDKYDGNNIGQAIINYIKTSPSSMIIYVKPVYKAIEGQSTLTVEYGGNTTYYTYNAEGFYDVTAPETGNKFLYWKLNENIISYNKTCRFFLRVGDNITATAVYGDAIVESKPISYLSRYYLRDEEAITFVYINNVPEGYTTVSRGVLYSTNPSLNDESLLVCDSTDSTMSIREDMETSKNSSYSFTKTKLTNKTDPVIIRGFVKASKNGVIYTFYSPITQTTVNDLKED